MGIQKINKKYNKKLQKYSIKSQLPLALASQQQANIVTTKMAVTAQVRVDDRTILFTGNYKQRTIKTSEVFV